MSAQTSQSSVFSDNALKAGFQKVWNRRLQQWVEVPISQPAKSEASDEQVSSNAFASGSNQNSGNFITDRSSTRVHAPPGGKTSFSFGHEENAPAPRAPVVTIPAATTRTTAQNGTSANVFATGSNQNSGNFITDKPTTRVREPPGGRSSFTMG